jgi:hypothetical protein
MTGSGYAVAAMIRVFNWLGHSCQGRLGDRLTVFASGAFRALGYEATGLMEASRGRIGTVEQCGLVGRSGCETGTSQVSGSENSFPSGGSQAKKAEMAEKWAVF